MRLKKRERLNPEFFAEVFEKAEILFLAFNDGEYPYCFPVNFVFSDNKLYIHCAREGHKLDCIRKDNRVSFSLCADVQIDLQKYTTYYKSICGRGAARILEDLEEKRAALDLFAKRYKSLCPVPSPDASVNRVGIIMVEILELSGKQNSPQPKK